MENIINQLSSFSIISKRKIIKEDNKEDFVLLGQTLTCLSRMNTRCAASAVDPMHSGCWPAHVWELGLLALPSPSWKRHVDVHIVIVGSGVMNLQNVLLVPCREDESLESNKQTDITDLYLSLSIAPVAVPSDE